jgi:hypothetical protein
VTALVGVPEATRRTLIGQLSNFFLYHWFADYGMIASHYNQRAVTLLSHQ